MSIYKSEQTVFDSQKKDVLLWRLYTNTVTFTYLVVDTFTVESKICHINYIRYHLNYFDSKYPAGFLDPSSKIKLLSTLIILN